jgi:hypothetical protein
MPTKVSTKLTAQTCTPRFTPFPLPVS